MLKKLTEGMTEHNKDVAAAKTDEERNIVVSYCHLSVNAKLIWTYVQQSLAQIIDCNWFLSAENTETE